MNYFKIRFETIPTNNMTFVSEMKYSLDKISEFISEK